MTTPRQIAANRQNAKKSTGPKSRAGKQRVRNNALKHGLAAPRPLQFGSGIEELVRGFVGDATDPITLELARDAAHAQFDLADIRRLRAAWIQRAYIFGFTERPGQRPDDITRMLASPNWRELFNPCITMPPAGPERLTEAIRRALPETATLQRYEARAIARRDRAIREMVSLRLKK